MKQLYKVIFMLCMPAFACCLHVKAQKKIAIIGSSTSDCYLVHTDSCYVGRLQQHYGSSVSITRLALSGSNVYRGMPTGYVPPANRSSETPDNARNITAALATRPDVVLVNYPSNGYDVFSITEVMYCLRTIRKTALDAGVPCYITTTQPRSDASFNTSAVKRKMADIKDSVLLEFGEFAIDFWNGIVNPADSTIISTLSAGDGVHLNNAGHKVLSDKVVAKNIVNSVLPVSFTAVTANEGNNKTVVEWATATEENIRHFQVEQSGDGVHFIAVQEVKAANRANSRYSVSCTSPQYVFAYYRIAAVHADGKTTYSRIIKIQLSKQSFAIEQLYTRAGTPTLQVQSAGKQLLYIQLVNQSGQLLAKTTATLQAGVNTVPLNLQPPGKGVYFLRMSDSGSRWQTRAFVRE